MKEFYSTIGDKPTAPREFDKVFLKMEPKPFFQLFTCVLAYSYTIMIIIKRLLIDAPEYNFCVARKHSKHKMEEQMGFQKMRAFIIEDYQL